MTTRQRLLVTGVWSVFIIAVVWWFTNSFHDHDIAQIMGFFSGILGGASISLVWDSTKYMSVPNRNCIINHHQYEVFGPTDLSRGVAVYHFHCKNCTRGGSFEVDTVHDALLWVETEDMKIVRKLWTSQRGAQAEGTKGLSS